MSKFLGVAGFTCQHFAVPSVGTMLATILCWASIRPQDFFSLLLKTMWYENGYILKIGMPIHGKQADEADQALNMAHKVHEIEGHGVVR